MSSPAWQISPRHLSMAPPYVSLPTSPFCCPPRPELNMAAKEGGNAIWYACTGDIHLLFCDGNRVALSSNAALCYRVPSAYARPFCIMCKRRAAADVTPGQRRWSVPYGVVSCLASTFFFFRLPVPLPRWLAISRVVLACGHAARGGTCPADRPMACPPPRFSCGHNC